MYSSSYAPPPICCSQDDTCVKPPISYIEQDEWGTRVRLGAQGGLGHTTRHQSHLRVLDSYVRGLVISFPSHESGSMLNGSPRCSLEFFRESCAVLGWYDVPISQMYYIIYPLSFQKLLLTSEDSTISYSLVTGNNWNWKEATIGHYLHFHNIVVLA